ncbi:MAG: hypothetical protein ABI977_16560 [Acidobacteriota bacterium]
MDTETINAISNLPSDHSARQLVREIQRSYDDHEEHLYHLQFETGLTVEQIKDVAKQSPLPFLSLSPLMIAQAAEAGRSAP